jgi:hypothetical protein
MRAALAATADPFDHAQSAARPATHGLGVLLTSRRHVAGESAIDLIRPIVGGVAGASDRDRFCGHAEVFEHAAHGSGLGDDGEHAQAATAMRASEHVDFERAPEQRGPVHLGRGGEQRTIMQALPVADGDHGGREVDHLACGGSLRWL